MCARQAVAGAGAPPAEARRRIRMCARQAVAGLGPRRPRRAEGSMTALLGDDDPVAAAALGLVQGLVGRADHLVGL